MGRMPMAALHVLVKREELEQARLGGKVVVVLDVLFATSTIVHVLAHGAAGVWPASDADDARRIAAGLPGARLAGEHMARPIDGFGPATPLALAADGLDGARFAYSTTNGTVALAALHGASHVYAAALLNGAAVARHVASAHPGMTVLLVCAGSAARFNLEDFYGAGHLVAHFRRLGAGGYAPTDSAIAAFMLADGTDAATALGRSRVGRHMASVGLQAEVACAARLDVHDVVPQLIDGCLQAVAA